MKKAGLPIQADAPDACLRNTRYARASRARAYGLYVTLRQLRHCIVETLWHGQGAPPAYKQENMEHQRELSHLGVGLSNPPSFSSQLFDYRPR